MCGESHGVVGPVAGRPPGGAAHLSSRGGTRYLCLLGMLVH